MMPPPIKTNWPLEVRRNDDGSLDEIVCDNAFVHLEQMDGNAWWMRVTWGNRSVDVWFSARGKITARAQESGE